MEVVWEPFFLNHNMPPEGEDLMAHLMNKYGPAAVERYGKPGNPLEVAGLKVGIHFNPERRIIPTLDAHRVCEWVKHNNPEEADSFMEHMFHAYFEAGKDLSKHDNLLAVVDECSEINRGAACAAFLAGDELANETSAKGRYIEPAWRERRSFFRGGTKGCSIRRAAYGVFRRTASRSDCRATAGAFCEVTSSPWRVQLGVVGTL